MRRLLAACLLAVLIVLPAVDVVACPDGCTDTSHPLTVRQAGATCAHDVCGLCLNVVAVDSVKPRIERLVRLAPQIAAMAHGILSLPAPALYRPPRPS